MSGEDKRRCLRHVLCTDSKEGRLADASEHIVISARGEIIMARNNRSTVIGVFDTRDQGHRAVEELRRAGFADSHITMVMHHDDNTVDITDMDAAKAAQVSGESKAGEGAAIGAIAGGLGYGAIALALGLIPGFGPVLTWGALAATLFGVGAAVGATTGGIVGALIGADFPEEEARFYETELKAGKVLVGVRADNRAVEARDILDRCGGYHALSPSAIVGNPE
jgi:Heat induced stress protein YflT